MNENNNPIQQTLPEQQLSIVNVTQNINIKNILPTTDE